MTGTGVQDHESVLGKIPFARRVPLPYTSALAFLVAAGEVLELTEFGPAGFLLLVVAGIVALVLDGAIASERRRLYGWPVFVAVLYGSWIVALAIISAVQGTWAQDTFVIIFGAFLLAIGPFCMVALRNQSGTYIRAERLLYLTVVLFSFSALAGELTIWLRISEGSGLTHERVFVAFYAASVLWKMQKHWPIFLIAATFLSSFVRYPSATTVLATAFFIAGILIVQHAGRRVSAILLLIGLAAGAALAAGGRVWLAEFYRVVGRTDNSETRTYLWDQAGLVLQHFPWTGGGASVSITGLANVNGIVQPVPFHNTLLTIGVVGGWPAVAMIAVLFFWALAVGLRLRGVESRDRAIWLPSFAAGLVSLVFNPVLERPGTALVFYVLLLSSLLRVPHWSPDVKK